MKYCQQGHCADIHQTSCLCYGNTISRYIDIEIFPSINTPTHDLKKKILFWLSIHLLDEVRWLHKMDIDVGLLPIKNEGF